MNEANRRDCFLCSPLGELVFDKCEHGFAMAGLGPILPGYSIVATNTHYKSEEEMEKDALKCYLEYANFIREKISLHYGSCLLTQHGKTPLCQIEEQQNIHCYHPHFLLFPSAPDILQAATEYFGQYETYTDILEAIIEGQKVEQYVLISPEKSKYCLIKPSSAFPRQFIRLLVAEAIGEPDLASWRDYPNLDKAISYANTYRESVFR